jgi:primosomal protein N''
VNFKRNVTASLLGLGSLQKPKEVWIIQSRCAKCGKSKEELEEELGKKGVI